MDSKSHNQQSKVETEDDNLRVVTYNASSHHDIISSYIARTPIANNQSAKALRLSDYDNVSGVLFLVLDQADCVRALSSIVIEEGLFGKCAKIYGRFHIEEGVTHTVIDRFFEPSTIQWCEDRGIKHLFFTINESNYKVLEWACRRVGERRNTFRANRFHADIGGEIRSGFIPLNVLIYERYCWQYAVYYSPDRKWFLERETKPLNERAQMIFRKEFSRATQNWD